ncbi:MAG TPA: site-specific DNA-methyltransferase [Ktedonobacteraceae bacterium]|nr:site-specific DNA-methyltransferase [Ktedonobacteraceae bacterium]
MNHLLNTITTGDARLLSQQISDESIDLIFCDPPYLKEYIPLYGWLSQEASRVLRPGGFLLTYVGNFWKYETMFQLGQHMTYFWDYVTYMAHESSIIWPRRTIARHKSILAFVKGQGLPRTNVLSAWVGSGMDKRYHVWGQDEGTARYYIDCFSSPGEIVLDPFMGGGTTAYVCKVLGRQFIGFEISPETADIARKRLETVQPLLMPEEPRQLTLESGGAA